MNIQLDKKYTTLTEVTPLVDSTPLAAASGMTVCLHVLGEDITYVNATSVTVVREVEIPGEDSPSEVHYTFNPEGLVTDVYTSKESSLDHNAGTTWKTHDEVVETLCEDNLTWRVSTSPENTLATNH